MKKTFISLSALALITGFAGHASASDYYEFSAFGGSGTEYDVACYGDTIYYGAGTAVYKTTVSVGDITKKDEPRFEADGTTPNANYQARAFTTPTRINLTSAPSSLRGGGVGEMYVDATSIYTTSNNNKVYAFNKTTGAYTSTAVNVPLTSGAAFLSKGGGKWWSGRENSSVYSYSAGDSAWTYEFTWPSMGGGHGDGMEYVNGFIFVSDMTSNWLAQWGQGDNPDTVAVETGWTEWNKFAYTEIGANNKYVEGMGFGALGHFWAGSGSQVYELGGGEIQIIIEPNPEVPEPSTVLLMGVGLAGLVGYSRKKKALKK